ncbi:MAG: serine/threonine-protein phosphatase [Acidobacteria bacterium]|nr:serine/threonine-protein phosphatase [Acidobacteriota bacterium]
MNKELHIASGAVSDRGLSKKRPHNEDSYLEMPEFGIYAVADGVGGAQAGEVASQMAMEILSEAFRNFKTGADAEVVMRSAIEEANSAIYRMAQELPQLSSMATTFVALHLAGSIATIAHVGDSRLYRVDREGNLFRETDDHSMVAEEVRAGRMTEEQAENHPSKNIISRALGAEPTVEPDIKTIMIGPGNSFLICSDGITRHVADPEIKGVLTFGGDPAEICEYLKGLCFERGAEDNLTAVVVKVASSSVAAGAGQRQPHQAVRQIDEDHDEPTIATARVSQKDDGPGELLELDTHDLSKPKGFVEPDTERTFEPAESAATIPQISIPAESSSSEHREPNVADTIRTNAASIFDQEEPASRGGGAIGKVLIGFLMLVVGVAVGLAAYRYLLLPAAEPPPPQLTPKTGNQVLVAFEENRRNVDNDPAGYLKEVPEARDAEDYYLRGRANILIGDYSKAREALVEAQKRLADSPAGSPNANVLKNDVAIALEITNDPEFQARLKKALSPANKPANTSINGNSNTSRQPANTIVNIN